MAAACHVAHEHTFPAFFSQLSNVVSVLSSVATDMSPAGDLFVFSNVCMGLSRLELAQVRACIALALHIAGCSTPLGVTYCH